jgi:F420-dependent oxidoreductase-like protein
MIGDDRDPGLDGLARQAARASEAGLHSVWMSQIFGFDALTALAVVGREVPGIQLGTGVVPTYPRHPMVLASQALTVQSATGGRLTLGIGLSHQIVIEDMFGYSFERPLRHMREYLSVLAPLVREGTASFEGETLKWNGALNVPGGSPCPILLAALGPGMLRLAGEVADGTITWMTGPATVAGHIVPSITRSAAEASRAAPRVVVALPTCVTDDEAAARSRASQIFAMYGQLPSYRAMLDREGGLDPGGVAVVGDEKGVRETLNRLEEGGATEFVASPFGHSDERARTMQLLSSISSG